MLRLVVADDEKFTRDCIVDFTDWSQHGVEIVGVASDGWEAFRLLSETKPDIAILDIQMPGITGLEVIEKLKDSGLDTVFIIVSSFDNFEYARTAVHLGVEEYLLKPFLPDEFLAAIYKAAERLQYLRGLIPASSVPAAVMDKDPFFSHPNFDLTADVNYPVQAEKALIESLQVGSEEDVFSRLEQFSQKVACDNVAGKKWSSCYLILYVELYRFCSLHNIILSRDFSHQPPSRNSEESEHRLYSYLRETCRIIYKTLAEQRSSSYLVKRALDYIKQHYTEDLSLDVIAESIFVSPSYLSSLFRQNIGKTYIEYLNSFRISKAKEIMKNEPHLKNYEVAEKVGYSPKYFAQLFKQIEGITLSDYRQSHLR